MPVIKTHQFLSSLYSEGALAELRREKDDLSEQGNLCKLTSVADVQVNAVLPLITSVIFVQRSVQGKDLINRTCNQNEYLFSNVYHLRCCLHRVVAKRYDL